MPSAGKRLHCCQHWGKNDLSIQRAHNPHLNKYNHALNLIEKGGKMNKRNCFFPLQGHSLRANSSLDNRNAIFNLNTSTIFLSVAYNTHTHTECRTFLPGLELPFLPNVLIRPSQLHPTAVRSSLIKSTILHIN